jgi:hypothetical protein
MNQIWWLDDEEALQQQAEDAGGVPPAVDPPDDPIAMEVEEAHIIQWHQPEGEDIAMQEAGDGPPFLNGVQEDYEGELVDLLDAALAIFGQGPVEGPPG